MKGDFIVYEDLEFTIENEKGMNVNCNIISLFPKDDVESYVVFIDGTKDENEVAVKAS